MTTRKDIEENTKVAYYYLSMIQGYEEVALSDLASKLNATERGLESLLTRRTSWGFRVNRDESDGSVYITRTK